MTLTSFLVSHLHGYAVSLTQEGPMKWSGGYNLYIQHNYTHWRDAITDFDGYTNTQIIRSTPTTTNPTAALVVDFDNGWYLPAAGQLNLLFGELVYVNASLTLVGGTRIEDTTGTYGTNYGDVYLWSSTEWDIIKPNNQITIDQVMVVKIMDGLVRSYDKGTNLNKCYVRSVINF